jgi:hypothetical protein
VAGAWGLGQALRQVYALPMVRGVGAAAYASLFAVVAAGGCLVTSSADDDVRCDERVPATDCACDDGRPGVRQCVAGGRYDACRCVPGKCVPGRQVYCSCGVPQGNATVFLPGLSRCGDDGAYGACECEGLGEGGSGGGGSGGAGGQGGSSGPLPPGGVVLSEGATKLIDLFVTATGVVIVRADGVAIVGRDGAPIAQWPAPREVTAAAFDGERLVVADHDSFTVLAPDLTPLVGGGDLAKPCRTALLMSGGRFICNLESDDHGAAPIVYELQSGAALATVDGFYQGEPVRRVPGTDDFVTAIVSSSPADYQLSRLLATHEVVSLGQSPYHGAFEISGAFAFYGNPATHLITPEGVMLAIYAPGCDLLSNGSDKCFVKDGNLGTLRGPERFVAFADNEPGSLGALADLAPPPDYKPFDDPAELCAVGCRVQRIDVTSRLVLAEKTYRLGIRRIVAVAHDATVPGLLLGYAMPSLTGAPLDPPSGYRVELLSYGDVPTAEPRRR